MGGGGMYVCHVLQYVVWGMCEELTWYTEHSSLYERMHMN